MSDRESLDDQPQSKNSRTNRYDRTFSMYHVPLVLFFWRSAVLDLAVV